MKAVKVAIATKGNKGLKDEVSNVFGRAKTFTIVEMDNGEVKSVNVLGNPAADYKFGAGPIVVKTLIDMKVDVVVASEFGMGASTLLDQHGISKLKVEPGDIVEKVLGTIQKVKQNKLKGR